MKTSGNKSSAEILAELEDLAEPELEVDPNDDAHTQHEWRAIWGISMWRANMLIRTAVGQGKMERVSRKRKNVTGFFRNTPCYKYIQK